MKHLAHADLNWTAASGPGITKAELVREASGGGMAFWSVPKNCGFARHSHKGYEYTLVVSGRMNYGGTVLEKGDFLLTSQDEEHEAVALEDAVILVINERANS